MAKRKPKDALDQFAEEAVADPALVVQLLLWKRRHANPDMVEQITEKDIAGFRASCEYMEATPEVHIARPQGLPARAAQPAMAGRRAVPAFAGEPPRPYVVVALVKKGSRDAIKPIENNEEDAKLRDEANRVRRYRDTAGAVAVSLLSDLGRREYSEATIREAAAALQALARAK
jgi:hypothetical protein